MSLYAKVSQTIPHAESGSLPDTIFRLTQDPVRPGVENPETKLRILKSKNPDISLATKTGNLHLLKTIFYSLTSRETDVIIAAMH
jgi:hypothetical protein